MRWVMIFAVGLAALGLAGCGGSNNASSNTTTTETTTTTQATTTTTSGGTTTSGSTTPNFASGKCKDLAASAQKIGQDFSAAAGGTGNLDTAAKEFQAFVDAVPSEIKPDVQTLADAFTAYANALKGVHLTTGQTPSAADLQKLQAATKSFDVQKVQAAEQHLQAWTKTNC
jgi:hypothetical protein